LSHETSAGLEKDGWRALAFVGPSGVVPQSRAGKPLHPYFPDVCAQLRAFLPPGCVADGELVAWESGRERTSFPLLQRRVTAGRRLPQEMREHPAHLVLFDLLQDAGGVELLRLPLVARRARLAELLTGGPPQLPLCPQTLDWSHAMAWFTEGSAAGLEGLAIKDIAGRYRPGQADWLKIKTRASTEAVIGGATGSLNASLNAIDALELLAQEGETS
jgi:ATP-dependent DNA ligase